MAAKIRLADIVKGGGAEFVFLGSGAPVIVSGGKRLVLEMRVSGTEASIILTDSDALSESVTICEGGVAEIAATYNDLIEQLRNKPKPEILGRHTRFFLGTAFGILAFSAVSLLSASLQSDNSKLTEADIATLIRNVSPQQAIALNGALSKLIAPEGIQGDATPAQTQAPILPRPDFLKPPVATQTVAAPEQTQMSDDEVEKELEKVSAETKQEAVATPENDPAPTFALPVFDPRAFEAEAQKTKSVEPKTEPVAEAEKIDPPAKTEATKPAEEAKPVEEAPKAPETAKEPEKAPEAPKQNDAGVNPNPQPPTSDKKAEAPANTEFKPITQEEARQQADKVVDTLLRSGMNHQQAGDVLQTLEALASTDYAEITPEMLSKLPHEVALLLRENGIIGDVMEPAYTDGIPHRIIRLPDSVVDKYRGKDGIPSIPEANSWAATGNTVRIPPPGGGDLKAPEDFARFGIQAP